MSLELFLLICYSFAPIYSKNQNFRWAGTLISDTLTQMLVPPFSLEILRKLPYFVFFTTKSLWNFSKLSKINLNYVHVKNNPKLTWQSKLFFELLLSLLTKICKNCRKDIKNINISFYFLQNSTKCCRCVVKFLLNSCANLCQNSHVICFTHSCLIVNYIK